MNISPTIMRHVSRGFLQVQKHSPKILTAVGIAGVVTAGVLASRATLKLEETVDNAANRLEHARVTRQSKTKAVTANVLDLVKLYGPSVTLGAASIVCIVSAQGILHKRNAALVAAYKGLESAYSHYREQVREAYGEDVDRTFALGVQEQTIERDGKKEKILTLAEDGHYGDYTFIFSPSNPNWVGQHEHNEFFLKSQENVLNDRLRTYGHVFLNEVLDRLGFERVKYGQLVGWVYDGEGDGFIDFQMFKLDSSNLKDYDQAEPGHILLDFNVDGVVWDKI